MVEMPVMGTVTSRWLRPLLRGWRAPWRRKRSLLYALPLLWKVRLGLWFSTLAALQKRVERWGRGRYSLPVDLAREKADAAHKTEAIGVELDIENVMAWREQYWALTRGAHFVPRRDLFDSSPVDASTSGRRWLSVALVFRREEK